VDRPRVVGATAYLGGVSSDPDQDDWQTVERGYEPIHPSGGGADWRKRISRVTGPIIAAIVALAKFSFVLVKFSSIFIAVAAYALIWGWTFAAGFVVLILVHELGHFIEAKREGLNPKLPVFIPFLGAYVQYTRGHPWQTVRVAIAGPILGGAASFVCYLIAQSQTDPHNVWSALAYTGFFLNLINLLPFGILDGGAVWRSARYLREGGGRTLAYAAYALYFATAAMLVLGMVAAHVPQSRL
jgi:Zn-dependent protease